MNEHLRDRILRKLDTLSEERAYQVLDYIEFLSSKYAERPAPVTQNVFTRFTEAMEDRLRAGKVSSSAIAETMSLMNRAVKVLDGVAAAGRSVATDAMTVASGAWETATGAPGTPGSPSAAGTAAPPGAPGSARPPASSAPSAPASGTTDSGEVSAPGASGAEGTGSGSTTGINPGGRT